MYEPQCDISFYGLDIICISESWLTSKVDNTFVMVQGDRADRASFNSLNTTGGGVCVYVKNDLPYVSSLPENSAKFGYFGFLFI